MMTRVVNLYGGPGTGKSTTAAGTFAELKLRGVLAELVTEYAKDKVWQGDVSVLRHYQLYVFAQQWLRIARLIGKVQVVVTDSPLLLSLVYGRAERPEFHALVRSIYAEMDNVDVFLRRVKPYETAGRLQAEVEARALDVEVENIVRDSSPQLYYVIADRYAARTVADIVVPKLKVRS